MELMNRIRSAVSRERLLATAIQLVEVPSRTGDAGAVSDRLEQILLTDGFEVERHAAGHNRAPAVVVRFGSNRPGRILQFNGHLDVVHLPFVPPTVSDGKLLGSGACDMKGGVAAMVEALRVVRDANVIAGGSILLTAHDLHEAPWGFGEQLDDLIRTGVHGDAVLIPEPLRDYLPIIGRGNATWKVRIRRPGLPVHEVMRPHNEPNVIGAGADLIRRLLDRAEELSHFKHVQAGEESLFVGQFHSGEIYNQYPQEAWLEGTRRWLPSADPAQVESEFRAMLDRFAHDWDVEVQADYRVIRNAFQLDEYDEFVGMFQNCATTLMGHSLPLGPKPFVDDGNSFWRIANIPAITHGARAGGQHTVNEWVDIDDLVRVATLYSIVASQFCNAPSRN
jgi:acetylornithine deacetylase/succinyl-diaminopimelate desuccinylase-like protein